MSDYKLGSMDVYDQEKTYNGFLKLGRIVGYICIGIVVFLAIVGT